MDPVKLLTTEHDIIKEAIQLTKTSHKLIGRNDEQYHAVISKLLSFFRIYGDKFHHHKEEDILFPEMNKKNELLEDGVIKEMLDNHEHFRELLSDAEGLLNKKDLMRVQQQLEVYCEALLDHIAVEDDEVFQMAESLFNDDEKEKIYFRFEDKDRELGGSMKEDLKNSLEEIKKNINLK